MSKDNHKKLFDILSAPEETKDAKQLLDLARLVDQTKNRMLKHISNRFYLEAKELKSLLPEISHQYVGADIIGCLYLKGWLNTLIFCLEEGGYHPRDFCIREVTAQKMFLKLFSYAPKIDKSLIDVICCEGDVQTYARLFTTFTYINPAPEELAQVIMGDMDAKELEKINKTRKENEAITVIANAFAKGDWQSLKYIIATGTLLSSRVIRKICDKEKIFPALIAAQATGDIDAFKIYVAQIARDVDDANNRFADVFAKLQEQQPAEPAEPAVAAAAGGLEEMRPLLGRR